MSCCSNKKEKEMRVHYACDCGDEKCDHPTICFETEPNTIPYCCGVPMKKVEPKSSGSCCGH